MASSRLIALWHSLSEQNLCHHSLVFCIRLAIGMGTDSSSAAAKSNRLSLNRWLRGGHRPVNDRRVGETLIPTVGNLLSQSRLRYSHRLIFAVIAGLIAAVAGLERQGLWSAPVEIAMLSVAMGMMNPALSKVGAESVSLTFVTGTLNRIGGNLAAAARRKPLTEGQGPGDSYLARARIDAGVWSGFLVGAGLSGMAASHFRMWALLPPCVVMIALGLFIKGATPSPEKRITSSISSVRSPV
jgi:uncharacterized membrane protein YoaK (UPF0700 family)